MKEKIDHLKTLASADEIIDLTMFYNARQRCRIAYNEDSTAARKKDLDAAIEGLNAIVAQLEQKYCSPATRTAAPGVADPLDVLFRNSTEMFDRLQAAGWGIASRQTLTNHAKNGSLQLQPDRSITAAAFEAWKKDENGGLRYYKDYTRNKFEKLGTIEDNTLRKSHEELKKLEYDNRKREREEQLELGRLITREAADTELCAWTGMLRDAIARRINQTVPAIIHAVSGQSAAIAQANALIDQAIDDACNDIANSGDIDVEIAAAEEDGA